MFGHENLFDHKDLMRKNVEEWSSVVTYSLTSFLDLVL